MHACAILVLRLAVSASLVGLAWETLVRGGPLFSWLFDGVGWSEAAALRVNHASVGLLLAGAAAAWWRRVWPVVLAAFVWLVAQTAAMAWDVPARAALIPFARATVVLAPLGLVLIQARPSSESALVCLRIAVVATFAAHGVQALAGEPMFLDYLFIAGRRVLAYDLTEAGARRLLYGIGAFDLLLAAAVLFTRGRWARHALLYMMAWGLLTALARTVHSGWQASYETLLRLPHAGVPAALWLWSRIAKRHHNVGT